MSELMTGGFGVVIGLFLFIIGLLWFLLPFAIFGTKDKLSEIIVETQKTNTELARLSAELAETHRLMALQGADRPETSEP